MAIATTPATFPDIAGPEFVRSGEVEQVARDVLTEHGKKGGVARVYDTARAIRDGEISVAWLLNEKPFDELNEEASHDAAGKCMKAPRLWHDLTGFDVAIWIRGHFWYRWDANVKAAAILHELLHVEIRRDRDGTAKVSIRKHDVEDFVDVVRHYGPLFGYAEGGASALVRAANLFAEGQGKKPSPLRALPGEKLALDETDVRPAGQVNADELRGDIDRAVDEPDDVTDLPR